MIDANQCSAPPFAAPQSTSVVKFLFEVGLLSRELLHCLRTDPRPAGRASVPRSEPRIMTKPKLRPWWPASPHQAAALALTLREDQAGLQLLEFVALAAAGREWDLFAAAIAALGDVSVRSVRNMLDNAKFDSSWSVLYGTTGMPQDLLPLFLQILRTAGKFPREDSEPAGRASRLAVFQQALSSPTLRGLKVPPELKAALLS
jgi:hypothetical protein